MTEKERIGILQRIESGFAVHELEYKGISIWPLLRLLYSFTTSSIKKENTSPIETKPKSNILFPIQQILNSRKMEREDSKGNLNQYISADILFVARGYNRREKYNEKYFSKYADGLSVHIPKGIKYSILEYSVFDVFFYPRHNRSRLINSPIYSILIQNRIKNTLSFERKKIKKWPNFLSFLKEEDISTNASLKKLTKDLNLILSYKKYFKKCFSEIRPKAIFFICYYTKVHMGLILACRDLNIKSIEVQHGEQSIFNYKYNGWTNVSKEGYELLPSHFWLWGMSNLREIAKWSDKTDNHTPVLGGNPWMNFYLKNIFKKSPMDSSLIEKIKNKKHKILVSLQYFDDFEKSPLPEAIRLSDDDFIWFIRLHPKLMADKSKVDALLKNKGCSNFDLRWANDLNLYKLFEVVDIQITFWSTVAYEALLFDIHTIIVHPYGEETLRDYIDKKHFKYTLEPSEIISMIIASDFEKEKEKFIETDDVIIKGQLESILELENVVQ